MPNDLEPVVGHTFNLKSQPIEQTEFSGVVACEVLEHTGFNPDDAAQQMSRTFMGGGWRSHVLRRLGEVVDKAG